MSRPGAHTPVRIKGLPEKQGSQTVVTSCIRALIQSRLRTLVPKRRLSRRSVSPVPRDFRLRNSGDVACEDHVVALPRRDVIA